MIRRREKFTAPEIPPQDQRPTNVTPEETAEVEVDKLITQLDDVEAKSAVKKRRRRAGAAIVAAAAVLVVGGLGVGKLKAKSGEAPEFPTTPAATAEPTPGVAESATPTEAATATPSAEASETTTAEPSESTETSSAPTPSETEPTKEVIDESVYDLPREEQLERLDIPDVIAQEAQPSDIAKIKLHPGKFNAAPMGTLYTVVYVPFSLENTGLGAKMTSGEAKELLEAHPNAAVLPVVENKLIATAEGNGGNMTPLDKDNNSQVLDQTQVYAFGMTCSTDENDPNAELLKGGFDPQRLNGNASIPTTERGDYDCSVALVMQTPNFAGATVTADIAQYTRFAALNGQGDPESGVTTEFGGSQTIKTIAIQFGDDGKTVEKVS